MEKTPDLEQELASWYHYFIVGIRWMADIGRVDLITEVSMMASQMAMHREGILEVVLHVFAFLRQNYNYRVVFDPTYPAVNMNYFRECNWKDFYG